MVSPQGTGANGCLFGSGSRIVAAQNTSGQRARTLGASQARVPPMEDMRRGRTDLAYGRSPPTRSSPLCRPNTRIAGSQCLCQSLRRRTKSLNQRRRTLNRANMRSQRQNPMPGPHQTRLVGDDPQGAVRPIPNFLDALAFRRPDVSQAFVQGSIHVKDDTQPRKFRQAAGASVTSRAKTRSRRYSLRACQSKGPARASALMATR